MSLPELSPGPFINQTLIENTGQHPPPCSLQVGGSASPAERQEGSRQKTTRPHGNVDRELK
ncbi:hypothetical protein EYF80_041367 [Liparis tanakae]|uniref:Uncharacterized protein n=1 Tax=Liparis tanakae TaxID=230148 RepID=A0A4Z2G5C4_9TELE|nr:hypothetical protein EYF80_041367 [Liparis tanakae]